MYKNVTVGDRKFNVIRVCREEFITEETKDSIKNNNPLIDVVLRDGKGNLLFCHEARDVQFRDLTEENIEPQ